jgi:transcriptional antiterminator RfaH
MKRWYAVHCKPRQDARAEIQLRNQGYELYRPLARVRRHRAGRPVTVTESLFPRYLFIRLDNCDENWAPIRSTRGVTGLVRWGACVPSVPEFIITALQQRTDSEAGAVDLTASEDFRPNDRVRIVEGPFAECDALFQARTGDERVVVLMEIMQQAQRLELPERAIRRY